MALCDTCHYTGTGMSTGLVACSYSVDKSGTVQNTVQGSSQNSSDKSTASKDTGSKDSTSGQPDMRNL